MLLEDLNMSENLLWLPGIIADQENQENQEFRKVSKNQEKNQENQENRHGPGKKKNRTRKTEILPELYYQIASIMDFLRYKNLKNFRGYAPDLK